VSESEEATAAAAIKPVHRPTNRASALGEMYDGVLSSKALFSGQLGLVWSER